MKYEYIFSYSCSLSMYRSTQSFQFRWVFSFVNAHDSLGKRSEMTSRIGTSLNSRKDIVKSARVADII